MKSKSGRKQYIQLCDPIAFSGDQHEVMAEEQIPLFELIKPFQLRSALPLLLGKAVVPSAPAVPPGVYPGDILGVEAEIRLGLQEQEERNSKLAAAAGRSRMSGTCSACSDSSCTSRGRMTSRGPWPSRP